MLFAAQVTETFDKKQSNIKLAVSFTDLIMSPI
jgi:hypothetical protein